MRLYFEREREACDVHETTGGDHGRIEVRRHYVSHDIDWLSTNRRFPGGPRFPALAMIAMIEAKVERNAKVSVSRRYYLSSAPLSARQFAHAARAAGLPVARDRCDHFTTLATLTSKRAATDRQLSPRAIADTTRSRRSRE